MQCEHHAAPVTCHNGECAACREDGGPCPACFREPIIRQGLTGQWYAITLWHYDESGHVIADKKHAIDDPDQIPRRNRPAAEAVGESESSDE